MPGINQQQSSKGPAISRAVPALQQIETGDPALAPAIGGAYPVSFRKAGQTDNPGTMFNPYRARSTMGGTQVITAAAGANPNWQLLNYDTISYDPSNGFSTTAHTYTIPATGYYFVAGRISGLTATTNNPAVTLVIGIFQNGSEVSRSWGAQLVRTSTSGAGVLTYYAGPFTAVIADGLYFTYKDVVDLRAALYINSADNITTDANINYFTLALMGS